MVVEHDVHGIGDRIKIGERLAHAHHHHVADNALVFRVVAHRLVGPPQLADDFGGGEIAVEALFAGRAERAIERAADLRRHTQRAAVVLGNEHHLNAVAGAHIQQPLAGAVPGFLCGHQFRRGNHRHRRQFFAQRFGQVGHGFKLIHPRMVYPAKHLLRAKRLFPHVGKKRRHLGQRHAHEIRFAA